MSKKKKKKRQEEEKEEGEEEEGEEEEEERDRPSEKSGKISKTVIQMKWLKIFGEDLPFSPFALHSVDFLQFIETSIQLNKKKKKKRKKKRKKTEKRINK